MKYTLTCPRCRRELIRESFNKKILFRCPGCGGQSATLSALRGLCSSKELPNRIWLLARESSQSQLPCPGCEKPMSQIRLPLSDEAALELDVCLSCQTVFFDPGELKNLPLNPEEKPLP